MKYFFVISIILIISINTFGQNGIKIFVGGISDSVIITESKVYFRFYNDPNLNISYLGKGPAKQAKNKMVIKTEPFVRKKGFFLIDLLDTCTYPIWLFVHDINWNPIPNTLLIVKLKNGEDILFSTDTTGNAFISDNVLDIASSIIFNSVGFYVFEMPLKNGECVKYDITLECTNSLYSENDKVIFKIKRDLNGFLLKQVTVNGKHDNLFQPVYFKHVKSN